MGLTFSSNGSNIELSGGYRMFLTIREIVSMAFDKELGEHYAHLKLMVLSGDEEYEEFYKKAENILSDSRFKNEDNDILDFLFMSDSCGKINYKTCGKLYNIIKDVKKENVVLRYYAYSKNDWEDFKQLLKDCYSHRSDLVWR